VLNILTYADRGIIPGASIEFSSFVATASDSPAFIRDAPDVGLGLLQAAFMGGYSIAIVISGHLTHRVRWMTLVSGGLSVWILAVIGSGLAMTYDSFFVLFFSRMWSGVSEAAFHVVAPVLIQDRGGAKAGLWLSIYLSAIPVGLAMGYVYGSLLANHSPSGWQLAFFIEALVALPVLVTILGCIRDTENNGVLSSHTNRRDRLPPSRRPTGIKTTAPTAALADQPPSPTTQQHNFAFTFWEEISVCFQSTTLLCIVVANSAVAAVVVTLGTFGGASILALELFDSEQVAAILFGSAAAVAGIIGTPLGGNLVDKLLARHLEDESYSELLAALLPQINVSIGVSVLFCFPTCIITNPVVFIVFLFFAWVSLFTAQSGILMSVMMSVDTAHRSNSIAFTTLFSHLLGDVPAPIIFGLLKDTLAPACNIVGSGGFENPEECKQQHGGIRLTLAVMYSWMLISIAFFELARRLAIQKVAMEQHVVGVDESLIFASNLVEVGGEDGSVKSQTTMTSQQQQQKGLSSTTFRKKN